MDAHIIGPVPTSVVDQFVALGAVKAGCMRLIKRDPYSGMQVWNIFHDLVYFFDTQDREIGYWSALIKFSYNEPTIVAPNYRTWSRQFLDNMAWQSLEPWQMRMEVAHV